MGFVSNVIDQRSRFVNEAVYDSFFRHRTSEPYTLWGSKLLGDARPLLWDEAETAGSGTSSSYDANTSSVTMETTAETEGTRVRQSKQRFDYQPGKSQLIMFTGNFEAGAAGNTWRAGYFDTRNGFFFQLAGTTLSVVKRSYVTGEVVDTVIAQAAWNLGRQTTADEAIDISKVQIFFMDFEWLAAGSCRMGFVLDGAAYYMHQWNHANEIVGPYMTTPNLPIRYEISNDGTGPASSLECICSSVISEGGQQRIGLTKGITTVPTHVDASTADTEYAIIGIKLKSTHLDNVVKIKKVSILNEGNTDFYWCLKLNPTVAGTFTYANEDNAPVQSAKGATANTITGGHVIDNGLSTASSAPVEPVDNLLYLGSKIDGTADEIVLCCTPLSANADIQATMVIEYA